ncbi:MAG: AraC family transcriptional regulator [Acetatifactor sp.]|nr:AraC family transcriptional regulator [Acetatifactor sp.]MDE7353463.1 AraC family transcriptional regulator [Acetatifactor sp.]
MTEELLRELKKITPEEERILSGRKEIEKNLYMSGEEDMVDAGKLLDAGKLIQVRPHTRFVHFPRHTHNYIEVIYMCSGCTRHVINGENVTLEQGELLFLSQSAVQEIYPAGEDDIAVNFIILPEFFEYGLNMMEPEENLLRSFIIDCLRGKNESGGYLHFRVADVLPVQNLVENLIWTIWHRQPNRRRTNQITMGLLFLQLMNCMDKVETVEGAGQQKLMITVLSYIETHYRDGELNELAGKLHYDVYWLSREIRRRTGRTYTELVQARRLNQAAYLLTSTAMPVLQVAQEVGYDNISYFHKIFYKKYGTTPRKFRMGEKMDNSSGLCYTQIKTNLDAEGE